MVGQLFGAAENLEIGIGTVDFVPNIVPFLYQFCTSFSTESGCGEKTIFWNEGVDKNNFFCFHYRFVACFAL